MKLLALLTDAYGGSGGISLYNRDFLSALTDNPETFVFAIARWQSQALQDLPASLKYQVSSESWFSYIKDAWLMARSSDFDAIFCGHINLLPVSVLLARIHKKPLILQLHGYESWRPTSNRLTNLMTAFVDRVLSVSELTLDRYISWSRTPVDRCRVIHNGIHREWFDPFADASAFKRQYGLEGHRVLMTFGRLESRQRAKGFDEVLQVLPEILTLHPDVIYVIAGDGPDADRLKRRIESLGLSNNVIFTGYVDESSKNAMYCAADVFVMPSAGEGFGYVFLEAMACGLPVIGSEKDGSREALRQGTLGELVDPGDNRALRDAILRGLKKERQVPVGLDIFDYGRFAAEVCKAVTSVCSPPEPV